MTDHRSGRLYGIGVGPGDPELLTLKGARILQKVDTIFCPEAKSGLGSQALAVVEAILNRDRQKVELLHFPMKKDPALLTAAWEKAASKIHAVLAAGRDAAFITIGDAFLYSTFGYILDKMEEKGERAHCEVIPGVSSITASAAAAGVPLARTGERVLILPATYRTEEIRKALESNETVVLIKVNRVLREVIDLLDEMKMTDRAVLVSRCGTDRERIFHDLSTVHPEEVDYLSTLIVTRSGEKRPGSV